EGSAYRALGKIQAATRNPNEARKYLNLSLDIFRELGDEGEVAYTLNDIANFEYEAGDTGKARETCAEALEMAKKLGIRKIVEQMTDLEQKLA
ncbi:MAG: tetratricopeptide repeat protein, partial [Anaerolineae bacterium]